MANRGSVYLPSRMGRGPRRLDDDDSAPNEVVKRGESQFEQEAKSSFVQLRAEQRGDSAGLRDDESILCHTPPAAEEPTKFQIVQPINLTFNVNQGQAPPSKALIGNDSATERHNREKLA